MGELCELPPLSEGIRSLSKTEADWLDAQYPNQRFSPEHCITCGGNKRFRWFGDEGVVVEYRCPCVDQWKLARYLWWSGIGLAYQRLSWRDVVTDSPERSAPVDRVFEYAQSTYAEQAGRNLLLIGNPGTGKTLLSVLLLKLMLAQGRDGYFTSFDEMVTALIGSWSDAEARQHYHKRYRNAGVLVIDDPGTELKARGGGTHETPRFVFESIVRHRAAEALPTIITTNIDSVDAMAIRYGANLRSLLTENTEVVRFEGTDWRESNLHRVNTEKAQGLTRPVTVA